MKKRSSALNVLVISIPLGIIALVLDLMGKGMQFQPGAGANADFMPLWFGILLATVVSFLFGWVRYDLSGGAALGLGVLHDLLITAAVTSLVSLVLPQPASVPALILSAVAVSYCLHVPVIREARSILRSVSSRELTREAAASQAVKNTLKPKMITVLFFLLAALALAVAGNKGMWGAMLPLVAATLVSCVSSRFLVPYIWAAIAPRRKGKR